MSILHPAKTLEPDVRHMPNGNDLGVITFCEVDGNFDEFRIQGQFPN